MIELTCPNCGKPMRTFVQNRISAGDPVVDALAERAKLKLPAKAYLNLCEECNHREVSIIELHEPLTP